MTQLVANVTESSVWTEFQTQARRQRRDPQKLLADYMRECLETWEDERLFREMRRQARRSGFKETDGVEIVRQVRQARKSRRAKA
ncbi:MAG: hypothetical protein ACKV2Q_04570 [Planctomycetaceae bacterium]